MRRVENANHIHMVTEEFPQDVPADANGDRKVKAACGPKVKGRLGECAPFMISCPRCIKSKAFRQYTGQGAQS